MLAIALVVLAALGLATDDPGFRIVKAIGEIDHKFADERMEFQFFGLHDHIESHFQIIAGNLGLTEEELSSPELVGQMFTIAWTWLQPRRSFKDIKRMFHVTLQCYENIIDVTGQTRTTGDNKICKSEILSAKKRWRAVRQHVNQILMYSERDGEIVPAPRGTMFRTQLDRAATQRFVMAYRQSVFERFPALLDSVLNLLDHRNAKTIRSNLSLLLKQPMAYENLQVVFDNTTGDVVKLVNKIRKQRSGAAFDATFNRQLEELRAFSAALPGLLQFIDEVLAYKLIMPDGVPPMCANLHKPPSDTIDPCTVPILRRSSSF